MAEKSLIIWIVLIIIGIFLAGKIGLFTIFIPGIGQPEGTESLINEVYYPATNTLTTCELTLPSSTYKCAQTSNFCSSTDPIKFAECETCGTGSPPCSARPVNCGLWNPGGEPIKDLGIYACSNENIVTQFCGSFGTSLVEDCLSQPCQFLSNYQTPDGFKDVVKCSGNYKTNQKLCVGNTLFTTSSDGKTISEEICGYVCVNNACVDCENGKTRCKQLPSTTTDREICTGGKWTELTGVIDITCRQLSNLTFTVTTESYEQSNMENITFFVTVIDENFKPIHENLVTNLQAITSLSQGQILENYITYLGSGKYKVWSEITGTGVYSGKLAFNYQGENYESPDVTINVVFAEISIGTNEIPPIAILDTYEDIIFTFSSSTGAPLDPDEIQIEISLPTGWEDELKTKEDLKRLSTGKYQLDYYFTQVEKYSFDITASKEGFATKTTKAIVAVTEEQPSILNIKWIIYGVIGAVIILIVIGRRRQ